MTNKEAQENIRAWVYWLLAKEETIPEDVIKALDVAQIALNERPQGEWIEGKNGNIKCNRCGAEIRYTYLANNKSDFPKFCCDCGADMRGKEE